MRRTPAGTHFWDCGAGNLAGIANTALARGNLGALGTQWATKAAVDIDATSLQAMGGAYGGGPFTGVVTARRKIFRVLVRFAGRLNWES